MAQARLEQTPSDANSGESAHQLTGTFDADLNARIRANCCEFHGLTPSQLEQHIVGIVHVVEQARKP